MEHARSHPPPIRRCRGEGCWHVYYATFASARIAAAWLWRHESGTYVKFTAAGAERFA
jgi:hypothetical protein